MPGAQVLDSYALLAYFRGEPRGAQVRVLLDRAAESGEALEMSDVNYAEVKYTLLKKDGAETWARAAEVLPSLPIEFHSTSRALADSAADFKARFKISLADGFAAALAKQQGAELVTGDPEFKPLAREIKIIWLEG
jgi:ribonuclease VapC